MAWLVHGQQSTCPEVDLVKAAAMLQVKAARDTVTETSEDVVTETIEAKDNHCNVDESLWNKWFEVCGLETMPTDQSNIKFGPRICEGECNSVSKMWYGAYEYDAKTNERCKSDPNYFLTQTLKSQMAECPGKAQCFTWGKGIAGHDIRIKETKNEVNCQRACKQDDACRYFAWRKSDNKCRLKSEKGDEFSNIDNMFGPKHCEAVSETHQECYTWGKGIVGHDIKVTEVDKPSACQQECQQEDTCRYFAWRSSDKQCRLKSEKGNEFSNTDNVFGPKHCEA